MIICIRYETNICAFISKMSLRIANLTDSNASNVWINDSVDVVAQACIERILHRLLSIPSGSRGTHEAYPFDKIFNTTRECLPIADVILICRPIWSPDELRYRVWVALASRHCFTVRCTVVADAVPDDGPCFVRS